MLHPVFSVLVKRPDLVAEHLAGYAQLLRDEAQDAGSRAAGRAVAWAIVLIAGAVCLTLTGVAIMMGVMLDRFSWVLVLVPGAMLAVALVAAASARKPSDDENFAALRAQLEADVQALRAAGGEA